MREIAVPRPRSARATAVAVLGMAGLLAVASQVAIPVPGTPVPITLQPMVVVLAGLLLGPRAGAMSMLLYVASGALGAPVFSPIGPMGVARLLGPTGGYLIAYPFAAYVTGWIGDRVSTYASRAIAAMTGMLVMYAGGVAQLAWLSGGFARAIPLGVLPFITLDVVKAHLAAVLVAKREPTAQ